MKDIERIKKTLKRKYDLDENTIKLIIKKCFKYFTTTLQSEINIVDKDKKTKTIINELTKITKKNTFVVKKIIETVGKGYLYIIEKNKNKKIKIVL